MTSYLPLLESLIVTFDKELNGEWIEHTKNEQLKSFKESLPLSIQIIIEWANKSICSK